jgi:hypothetical protein
MIYFFIGLLMMTNVHVEAIIVWIIFICACDIDVSLCRDEYVIMKSLSAVIVITNLPYHVEVMTFVDESIVSCYKERWLSFWNISNG